MAAPRSGALLVTAAVLATAAHEWRHGKPVPLVLIAHAWAGQGEIERNKAVALAELGYAGFAVDLYGKGRRGNSVEENTALMTPFMQDRSRVVRGMRAALDFARGLDHTVVMQVACHGTPHDTQR